MDEEPEKESALLLNAPSNVDIPKLKLYQKLSFGSGNFLNVLAVSLWFPYNVTFFHNVLDLSPKSAGNIVLAGQIGGTLSTLFIGLWSDQCTCKVPGRRKVFQLLGVTSVALAFFFMWSQCFGCEGVTESYKILYYSCFAIVFQFGWASTQIGQLALLPELTKNKKAQVELSSIRYSFSIIANIFVFVCFWGLLLLWHHRSSSLHVISHEDKDIFMILAGIVIIVGVPMSIPFQLFVPEKQQRNLMKKPWYKWMANPTFYMTGLCFIVARYVSLLPQTYIPYYFTVTLKMDKGSVAKGPLVLYISGFISTLIVKQCRNLIGDKMTFFVGVVLIWGSMIFFWVKDPTSDTDALFDWSRDCIYLALMLLGAGGAVLIVISLSMIAFHVGEFKGSSAFVYSCVMCGDRLANGVGVSVIQHVTPSSDMELAEFYRSIIVYVLMVGTSLGLLVITALKLTEILPFRLNKIPTAVQNTRTQNNYNAINDN